MAGRGWLLAGIVALAVTLTGVGVLASPWCGWYGPGHASRYGPGYTYGYGPGMMRGYGPGMMWGYWNSGSASPGATATASVTVRLDDMRFQPAQITVKAGTTVAFVNTDGIPHNVVNASLQNPGATPAFASPLVQPGQSWTHTFDTAGTFPILCSVPGHAAAGMVGTVTVTP